MSATTTVAVVLGSGMTADGEASHVTALRAKAAAAFIKSRPITLILSGSRAPNDPGTHGKTEAQVMAEIVKAEVADAELLLEDQSFDTLGNAIFTANRYLKNFEPGTLYVVTSPFHMERSLFVFRHVLGDKWTVIAHEAPEWVNETRQAGASQAMERAREFFSDVEVGDLDAALKKLIERIPAYADRAA